MEEVSASTSFMKKVFIVLVIIVITIGASYAIFYNPEPTQECAPSGPLATPINSGEQNPF